jgi:predicted transposase YbfD/YdcC
METIIFLTIAAVVSGCDSFTDIEDFGNAKLGWLKKFVDCPDDRIPSHDTLGDFYKRLDPEKFQECFVHWTSQVCGITEGELISIDGKTLRRSHDREGGKAAIHMVSAWAGLNELVLGQVRTAEKSNEITAIPALLRTLELKGAIVSIDAMGCQKAIASQIIEQKADYILALKDNQEELHEQVKALFRHIVPCSTDDDITKDHGRIEQRRCTVIDDLGPLDEAENWESMRSVVRIETVREVLSTGKKAQETRYYISSLNADAQRFNALIRGHWAIENSLHWVLDVNFNEDESRLRKGHADQNMSTIRRIALNLIKLDPDKRKSQRVKRKKAAWSDPFRESLLRI